MRFAALASLVLASSATASTWLGRSAYNKWHETELERWLSDHDIPYPTASDRKDLEKLVQENWNERVVAPYSSWSTDELKAYLKAKGIETQDAAAATKDSLATQVQSSWYETEDKAQNAWISVKDWMLDTWTDSQLKAFADKHGIPVPQPRARDTLLQKLRANYETIAKKAGQVAAYPGNWLYESWSESDLKEWLDVHGFPAPQPTTRDKLVASVRRNSRLAYLKAQDQAASASASAQAAYATVTDKLIDAWTESDLKAFLDKNSIPVPQGTKAQELRALVRKHRAEIMGDTIASSASSAFGAATTAAGNQFAKATDSAQLALQEAFDAAVNQWSESRLKAYLDARGIPVPHASKTDELRALVRKNAHKAASGWTAWTFDDFTYENLKAYLASSGDVAAQKIGEQADVTREQLVVAAQAAYASASSAGGVGYASATSYLAQATASAKKASMDTWSESDVKAYLDSYGIPVPQGSTLDEMRAFARRQQTFFKYGTTSPSGAVYAKIEDSLKGAWDFVAKNLHLGADAAASKVEDAAAAAHRKADEQAAAAHRKADEVAAAAHKKADQAAAAAQKAHAEL